ncbi:cellulase family glycosylhydrolase [Aquimarina litoralis]|uniref:cellulase family glycosylhydrolase n=1 Tax=Aquimarina litoralis TaxID=584605 RepID=UPI001C5A490E|nr:cellulase family glycosylhydrolase [Aquimarina litoralis]MBW1295589.1 cellulase family glycosylhydrolase [Aquimarina litoralis]
MKQFINFAIVLLFLLGNVSSAFAQQQNWLSVSGNKLFDSTGKEVRLTGVNWFGFETQTYFPHGIWSRDMKSVLQQIKDLGFNTIRVPWSNEMLNPSSTISINSYGTDAYTGISPMNEEESQITKPIELMDILVQWCQDNDIKIVLDNHSRAADGYLAEDLWYTNEYSEQRWINDWLFMTERYKNYSAVVGMDLNNEPHGSSWGNSNPATDWNKAAERCGNAILEVNPNVLIIVEGVGEFEGNSYWWGGQLMGARQYPVQLSNPSKLMYSAHEYGPEVAPQDWFEAASFPQNMPPIWTENFHYLYEEETSPLFIGEFGIKDQDAFGGVAFTWFTEWVDFMGSIYSWTFWTMNPNSGDTGGILQDDWTTVNEWKMDVLRPHFAPFIPNVVGGTGNLPPSASFTNNPSSGNAPLTVQFDASQSSDPDGDALSYSWNFGDGTTATGVSISHLFDAPGSYQVSLTVSDGSLNDTVSKTITVNDDTVPTVTASISVDTNSGVAPATISFDGSSSASSDGSALLYNWDFGDGTSGSGAIVDHEYTTEGSYIAVLTVTNADGISDTEQLTITITGSGNGGDCTFGAPLANSLPTIANASYSNIYVFGSGGPDLSNVTNFTINWDLQNNGLWQLSMNTNNGVPSWWNDLKNNITSQNFNAAQPSITLSGTGFANLDGAYYATQDGQNFALVAKNKTYTIYFSNSNTAPNCSDQLKKPEDTSIQLKAFPNPVLDRLVITTNNTFETNQVDIVDVTGKVLKRILVTKNVDSNSIEVDFSDVKSGIYFVKVRSQNETITKQIVKQ